MAIANMAKSMQRSCDSTASGVVKVQNYCEYTDNLVYMVYKTCCHICCTVTFPVKCKRLCVRNWLADLRIIWLLLG